MITVKTTTEKQEPKPFPKLMRSVNGNVVLFYKNGEGVLIEKVNSKRMEGEYITEWDMDNFTDYNQPITIQNA